MSEQYFLPLEIWENVNNENIICYCIFKRISDSMYAVQSKDTYDKDTLDKVIPYFKKQCINLFLEQNINERGIFRSSIEDAIKAFDESF
jgi:hypothetical protein